jgi:hypothetical protein
MSHLFSIGHLHESFVHIALHGVTNSVLSLEWLSNHGGVSIIIHYKVLAHHFNVSVEALKISYWVASNRFHIETTRSRVDFVSKFTFNLNIVHMGLLLDVANHHPFSNGKSLDRVDLLFLTPSHHGVTSIEVLADVAT